MGKKNRSWHQRVCLNRLLKQSLFAPYRSSAQSDVSSDSPGADGGICDRKNLPKGFFHSILSAPGIAVRLPLATPDVVWENRMPQNKQYAG